MTLGSRGSVAQSRWGVGRGGHQDKVDRGGRALAGSAGLDMEPQPSKVSVSIALVTNKGARLPPPELCPGHSQKGLHSVGSCH